MRQKLMNNHKLSRSISHRGNCWDNASHELVFEYIKDEINLKSCTTFETVIKMIDKYIGYFSIYGYQWDQKKMVMQR